VCVLCAVYNHEYIINTRVQNPAACSCYIRKIGDRPGIQPHHVSLHAVSFTRLPLNGHNNRVTRGRSGPILDVYNVSSLITAEEYSVTPWYTVWDRAMDYE